MGTQREGNYDYLMKIIIIGDSGVGKTNFISRFCQNSYKDNYVATIGVDFKIKSLTLDSTRYKLQIWDTAGQQRFKNITQTYYKGAVGRLINILGQVFQNSGILLTYSIADESSFQSIGRWLKQIQLSAPKDVGKILIGTKCDLEQERSVPTEKGEELAQQMGIPFIEVSAKDCIRVRDAFQLLIKEIKKQHNNKLPTSMRGGTKISSENNSLNTKICSC